MIKKWIVKARVEGGDLAVRDIELINRQTQREHTPEEVYAFRLHTCDNDVDRDLEAFTVDALVELSVLLEGKSILVDHMPKAENQMARIYRTMLEDMDEVTGTGEPLVRLVVCCYMLRTDTNKDFIAEIEAGIKREASVGCHGSRVCSICGKNRRDAPCAHAKGKSYDGRLCYHRLSGITDAFEVSFVAVPAQRRAGVIKSYTHKHQTGKEVALMGIEFLQEKIRSCTDQIEQKAQELEGVENVAVYKSLSGEITQLEQDREAFKQLMADAINKEDDKRHGGKDFNPLLAMKFGNAGQPREDGMEQRVEKLVSDLKAGKEITVTRDVQAYLQKQVSTSNNIVLEEKYSRNIAEGLNEVAQTVDLVDSFTLDGGKAYTVAFAIDTGDAGYTEEGNTYTNDEGTFGENDTGTAKITNSAIVTEEVVELPNADYLTKIINNVRKSIRKKMSNQIVAGTGGTNQLRGLYSTPANAMPTAYKVVVDEIDEGTLRKIVFAYGGDEDVESPATLFLNKKDLEEFAGVMATDGRPVYAITYNGPSGTIEQVGGGLRVPYTINSACKAITDDTVTAGSKTMMYGDPKAYELPMFSPLTIKRSDERYIEQGKVGFFGKVICGGVVNRYKAFLPVVKG